MNDAALPAAGGAGADAARVVFIDDDRYIRDSVAQLMELEDIAVSCHAGAAAALETLGYDSPVAVVSDIKMPGIDGLELLRRVKTIDAGLPVILITGHGDVAMAVAAMRDGAYDFIEKPYQNERLVGSVRRALASRALCLENRALRRELDLHDAPGRRLIGRSPAARALRAGVARFAGLDADVLLSGETGTGKDLVARTLHAHGGRSKFPFVAINCGALPEQLIESELFGHAPGAFTGAAARRVGKFEYADGGTVFLDEIESMPPAAQVKLLRVLQERAVEPLGDNRVVPVDVRVVAAAKPGLQRAIAVGRFRADLYYRLNVLTLTLPPLRERVDDVPLLFQHFALLAAERHDLDAPALTPTLLPRLLAHRWPGNVRELRNCAERFVLTGGELGVGDGDGVDAPAGSGLAEQVERFEKTLIEQALARHRGVINDTLADLRLPRKTLYDKMRKYGLDKRRFKRVGSPDDVNDYG